jgi:hypothetical protein
MKKVTVWYAASLVLCMTGLAGSQETTAPAVNSIPAQAAIAYRSPESVPVLPKPPRRYKGPDGFAGHEWGEPRKSFTRLPEKPLMLRAAWTRGEQRDPEFVCTGVAASAADAGVGGVMDAMRACNINDVVTALSARKFDGAGFHVLSEYKIEAQGFRFTGSGVTLYPVIYQFCAQWNATKREVPENYDEINQFCGMRLLFETETLGQLRALPEDHVTRYELVLSELISRYGKPANFLLRGRVTVQTLDGASDSERSQRDRKFSSWRWCPAKDRYASTLCRSSIILSIDPEAGRAVVLFATPWLWEYAHASQAMHDDDPLFALMHGRQPRPVRTDSTNTAR